MKENNIQIHFTSISSSNSNSTKERVYSTLLEHLRIIKNHENLGPKESLYKTLYAYTNSINQITKFTLFELFFGRKIDDPLEIDMVKIRNKRRVLQTKTYENSLNKKLKYIEKLNKNRSKPLNLPPEGFLRVKPIIKLQARNRKTKIQRQKKLHVYDFKDIKHHNIKINKPRKCNN